jgi:hypothetical protein
MFASASQGSTIKRSKFDAFKPKYLSENRVKELLQYLFDFSELVEIEFAFELALIMDLWYASPADGSHSFVLIFCHHWGCTDSQPNLIPTKFVTAVCRFLQFPSICLRQS